LYQQGIKYLTTTQNTNIMKFEIRKSDYNSNYIIVATVKGYLDFICESGFGSISDAEYALSQNKEFYTRNFIHNKHLL